MIFAIIFCQIVVNVLLLPGIGATIIFCQIVVNILLLPGIGATAFLFFTYLMIVYRTPHNSATPIRIMSHRRAFVNP